MVLTTNRIKALDAAFESRVDISLAYRDLDRESRAQVWRNFLRGLGSESVDMTQDDVEKLAESVLNGRQIKSAVKTACILAGRDHVPLSLGHLKVVISIRERAMKLLGSNDGTD